MDTEHASIQGCANVNQNGKAHTVSEQSAVKSYLVVYTDSVSHQTNACVRKDGLGLRVKMLYAMRHFQTVAKIKAVENVLGLTNAHARVIGKGKPVTNLSA